MRPLRLEMKGFTAFRDEQVVDFDGLDLFAIAGPTGSGKTSILDAITYALFGTIDRVGKQAGQFVSQGQTRMAVCLEFAVDTARYRVTRSTPAKGATKILLERAEGDGWVQAGEGADRVREADAMIREAIGLDYDAFTRTVLLPQGRFAEFLVGDAKQRREILTDLLGLHLFERLARRAGEHKRAATIEAETRSRLLETEYAGVTAEAVARAQAQAAEAAAVEEALAAAKAAVDAIAERGAAAARSVRDLRTCARDVREAASTAANVAERLDGLIDALSTSASRLAQAVASRKAAVSAARKAATALRTAEERWGRERDLVAAKVRAEAAVAIAARAEQLRATADAAQAGPVAATERLGTATQTVAVRIADAEAAMTALDGARTAVEEAAHADHVAAVRSQVAVGQECPVCGNRIATLPKGRGAPTLDRAKAALEKAGAAAAAANEALAQATAARDAAERDLRDAEREAERLAADARAAEAELETARTAIRDVFGGTLPADPVAKIEERLAKLEALQTACDEAEAAATEATATVTEAESGRAKIEADVASALARLDALALTGLLERTRVLAEEDLDVPGLAPVASDDEPAARAAAAGAIAEGLTRLADGLDGLADRRAAAERTLLQEALRAVGDLVAEEPTLEALGKAVTSAGTSAAKDAATAARHAEDLANRLAHAGTLVGEIAEHRRREERFDALAKELRADRIIAFLQVEALQLLAAAGSERLSTLSSDRYRLEHEDDEFFVVDTWNGEERRSARTLSGGETFLASLALALGLSEQVGALSVTEKARLDSLFLDEGFGMLDPDTLEVVVEAIEQLGGDGRMVGVITHVPELAARLPTTIRVEKSPRGSRLEIVTP